MPELPYRPDPKPTKLEYETRQFENRQWKGLVYLVLAALFGFWPALVWHGGTTEGQGRP